MTLGTIKARLYHGVDSSSCILMHVARKSHASSRQIKSYCETHIFQENPTQGVELPPQDVSTREVSTN
jgi:hypothetical protein